MKHLITVALLFILSTMTACNAHAQSNKTKAASDNSWAPNPLIVKQHVTVEKTKPEDKKQCWATTTKGLRCKRMIDPAHPGQAVKVGDEYYCAQHIVQARR